MIDKFGTKLNILLPILPSILIRFTDKKKALQANHDCMQIGFAKLSK